jgi:hypothetical protein
MSSMPPSLGLVALSLAALAAPAAPAQPRLLLVASGPDSFTARGLTALGVSFERRPPAEFAAISPFRYDLILWGMDESRTVLATAPEQIAAFLDAGGVMACFRGGDEDPWLPSPARRDKAYQLGRLLRPEHPVFTAPHRLGEAELRDVHSGSIYRAFHSLGDGWVPLVSTGAPQTWDTSAEAAPGQEHFGMLELRLGAGRLLMVQMLPEYHWFHDRNGDPNCAGARLFENLVRYALAAATPQAAARPEPQRPATFVDDLGALRETPCGFGPDRPPALDWSVATRGPYRAAADRRGVWTVTHADEPSTAGNSCELVREFVLPEDRSGLCLEWYYSDTYCGGAERILGGAEHGKAAFVNQRKDHRFAQVLVNGRLVWEQDTHGHNPQPARNRFYSAEIPEALRDAGGGTCRVTLRLEDRLGSGDRPFAVDAFWAAVAIRPGILHIPASRFSQSEVLRLEPGGKATVPLRLRPGATRLAVRLQDRVQDRPELTLDLAGKRLAGWSLTADDHRWHWAVTDPLDLPAECEVTLCLEGAPGSVCPVAELAAVPHCPPAAPPENRQVAAPPQPCPASFALGIRDTAGCQRQGEVATQGLPFAAGALRDVGNLRLRDAEGVPVPCQATTLVNWPDGTVRAAVVSFPVRVGPNAEARYRVETTAEAPPAASPRIEVTEEGDSLTIDTGVITASVSRTHGRLVDSVRRRDGIVLKRPEEVWDLAIEDESGRVVRSAGPTVTEARFADRGPLRVLLVRTGSFADSAGRFLDYRLHLEATAGSDALRYETIIVNREAGSGVFLKRWSLDLAGLGASRARVWLGAEEAVAAGPGAVLYQHREDRLTWTGPSGARDWAAGQSPGFVRAGGVAFGPRWFWQRFPQCLHFAADGLRYDLIPPAYDDRDLPTRWQQRMAETTDRYQVGGVGYPQSPGKMGLFRLAPGEALHQEVLFAFDGAPAEAEVAQAMAPLTNRLRAVPDPAYTAATGVYPEFHPADGLFPRYETSVEAACTGYLAKRKARREYGFENYGDDTFEWGYGPSYTYWSNSEYDHHHAFLLQYLRSGDPRWWELAEEQARQYRDVVVVHAGTPDLRGGPRHHNATALWMPQHEEQYWVADHTASGASCGHSWAEGMVEYWLLTGDPWSGEVVRDLADWYCNRVENNDFGAGGQERGPGWALIAISGLAATLQTERLRRAGETVADWLRDWQDPMRGVISVPISEQPSYEGGSVFMHGIVGRALGRWAEITGDRRVRLACLGIAQWITTEPMGAKGCFWYKQSPENSRSYGATDQCLTALTYAYRLSGDPWFAEVALALYRQTGASTRSMSWYPQALAQLAPWTIPAEVTVDTEELVVAPALPRPVELRLRNTSAQPLRVAVKADVPAPFTLAPPAELELAPGEERLLAVRIGTRDSTGRTRLPITVVLGSPDGVTHTRVVSLRVQAVDQLVELLLGVETAVLTPPMVCETLDGRLCTHTPRTPQTALKPRPQDRPEGGSAQFTVEVPTAGRYVLVADVFWLDEEGNSFYLAVDNGPDRSFGNTGPKRSWTRVEAAVADLAAGRHTLRVRTREDGARLAGLTLERRPGP